MAGIEFFDLFKHIMTPVTYSDQRTYSNAASMPPQALDSNFANAHILLSIEMPLALKTA